jgi:hypothetical protein
MSRVDVGEGGSSRDALDKDMHTIRVIVAVDLQGLYNNLRAVQQMKIV